MLEQTSTGKETFAYHSHADMAISLGMSVREEPYGEQQCEAFFGGLKPIRKFDKKIAHNSRVRDRLMDAFF